MEGEVKYVLTDDDGVEKEIKVRKLQKEGSNNAWKF